MKAIQFVVPAVSKGQSAMRSKQRCSTACLFLVFVVALLHTVNRAAAGTIYFTDWQGYQVRANGSLIGGPVQPPFTGEGQITALAVDANSGIVYAATSGGITKNSYSGSTLLVGGIQNVSCLTLDSSGNLYALDGSGVLFKITPDTNVSVSATVPGAGALVFDQAGNFYTTSGTNVNKTTPGGDTSLFATLVGSAPGVRQYFDPGNWLCFDSQSNLFVATTIGVERIAADGTDRVYCTWADAATNGWPRAEFAQYGTVAGGGLCVDELDNVYFTSTGWWGQLLGTGIACLVEYSPGSSGGVWTLLSSASGGNGFEVVTAIAYIPLAPVPSILILPSGAAAPSISAGPQSETVSAFQSASLTVTAIGKPLNYQWSLNGTNISGATSSSFSVSSVTPVDLGVYTVVVSNALGIATSNAVLSMYPYLSKPFGGAVTYWGKDATLSVEAWGTGPLSYQWLKDGVAIPGAATNSLSLSSIQFTNAGLYSVVVSSALGSVTNPPAQVVVNPAGVSLALYSGITIDGVVGLTYGIQSNTNLSNTNSWQGMANVTLSVPTELWFDVQPANQRQRFYRVVPGPISIP